MKLKIQNLCLKATAAIIALALVGCASSAPSGALNSVSYTPFSSYFKQVKGDSNLREEYPDHPRYEGAGKYGFEEDAKDYLEGVTNDLEEIEEKSEDAKAKIEAVSDAFRFYNGGHLYVSSPYGLSLRFSSGETNFSLFGYEEFNEWPLSFSSPIEPGPYADRYDWKRYKEELLDFAATADAYIEDGNHYIRNCANDHETVRQAGLTFIQYLELLDTTETDLEVNL